MGTTVTDRLVELKVNLKVREIITLPNITTPCASPTENILIPQSLHLACLVRLLGSGPEYKWRDLQPLYRISYSLL